MDLAVLIQQPSAQEQQRLFEENEQNELTEKTVVAFLTMLREHVEGKPCNAVRGYVDALRGKVTTHDYHAQRADGSDLLPKFSLGEIDAEDEPHSVPILLQVRGTVAAIVFTPGKQSVTIDTSDEIKLKCQASPEQVEKAIDLHRLSETVEARVIQDKNTMRLLSLRDASIHRGTRTEESRTEHIFTRWSHLLEELAK